MLNKEKYIDDIIDMVLEYDNKFAVNKNTMKIEWCLGMYCKDCLFDNDDECSYKFREWLNEKYKELPLINEEEYILLKSLDDEWKYIVKIIANNRCYLYLCMHKVKQLIKEPILFPYNKMFKFITDGERDTYEIKRLISCYEKYYNIEVETV